MNIYLIGFMGSGKTTVSSLLAGLLHTTAVEMDERIAKRDGRTIPEIFRESGEAYFRTEETEVLREIPDSGMVVSCGGGLVLRSENVRLMRERGKIVLLDVSAEEVLRRIGSDASRPVLAGRKTLEEVKALMDGRKAAYEAAADYRIPTDGISAEQAAEEIAALFGQEKGV